MKKVIITGATSFIGLHLIDYLEKQQWKIYAVVRRNSSKIETLMKYQNVQIIELNMDEYKTLPKVINTPCDAYISLAWNGTRGEKRADAMLQEENYKFSIEALKAICCMGCKVVISAGSQAEYGPMVKAVNENERCNPNTEYGKWKLRYYEDGMKICRQYGIAFKEPRFFSLYGEGDNKETMILSILDNMLKNRECKLTQCIQKWNFLYIEDAVEGIVRLMTMPCDDGAYNFGSDDTRALKEFVMEMYKLTDSHSKLMFGAIPYPQTGMVNVYPDVSKLKQQTGWRAKTSFSKGISKILIAEKMEKAN